MSRSVEVLSLSVLRHQSEWIVDGGWKGKVVWVCLANVTGEVTWNDLGGILIHGYTGVAVNYIAVCPIAKFLGQIWRGLRFNSWPSHFILQKFQSFQMVCMVKIKKLAVSGKSSLTPVVVGRRLCLPSGLSVLPTGMAARSWPKVGDKQL